MADDFRVTGADDFLKLSKALKDAGRTELRKELNTAMRQAAKPLIADAREAARRALPHKGGLAERVATKTQFRVGTRTGANPGVYIGAPRKNVTATLTNATGRFRHPAHADPEKTRKQWKWVDQQTDAQGWFDNAMNAEAHKVLPALEQAVDNVIGKVARGG